MPSHSKGARFRFILDQVDFIVAILYQLSMKACMIRPFYTKNAKRETN